MLKNVKFVSLKAKHLYHVLFTEGQKDIVTHYLAYNPRYKLFVVRGKVSQSNDILDFGHSLSVWISGQDREDENFQFRLQQEVDSIMQKGCRTMGDLGEYRIVSNIGILFEPSIEMSPLQFIKKYSKECLLILYWDGVLKDHCLYLPDEDSNCIIDLTGINYLSI